MSNFNQSISLDDDFKIFKKNKTNDKSIQVLTNPFIESNVRKTSLKSFDNYKLESAQKILDNQLERINKNSVRDSIGLLSLKNIHSHHMNHNQSKEMDLLSSNDKLIKESFVSEKKESIFHQKRKSMDIFNIQSLVNANMSKDLNKEPNDANNPINPISDIKDIGFDRKNTEEATEEKKEEKVKPEEERLWLYKSIMSNEEINPLLIREFLFK